MILTYPSSVYGYVTEKRAGSTFVLMPASVFEKFLSMILNTVVVVPLAFGLVYLSIDGIICLLDGTCGGSLFSCAARGLESLVTFAFTSDAPVHVSLFSMYMSTVSTALFFLLGAIFFKKHKILYPILIIVGFQMALSMVFGLVLSFGLINIESLTLFAQNLAERYILNPDFLNWAIPAFNILATLWDIIVFAALATAVYFRLKTIKH